MHDTQNAFPKFLHISWFLKTDPNEAAKLNLAQAGHPWGRRCLVFMALVNSLHLGDHWEVGTGRNWAVWNVPKKPRKSHGRNPEASKMVIHLDGWQFGSYCMWQIFYQLSWVIYFYLEGEEGRRNEWVTRISIHDVVIAPIKNLWICFLACRGAMLCFLIFGLFLLVASLAFSILTIKHLNPLGSWSEWSIAISTYLLRNLLTTVGVVVYI